MFYRSFVGMNWFFIVVLNKGNKIENIICIMITLSFFNKLLSLYFYAIYCECNSFIFRIVQDERKQIAFKSEEHSNFYYLFRVFSLKYHKIEMKKKISKKVVLFMWSASANHSCVHVMHLGNFTFWAIITPHTALIVYYAVIASCNSLFPFRLLKGIILIRIH